MGHLDQGQRAMQPGKRFRSNLFMLYLFFGLLASGFYFVLDFLV